MWTHWRMSSGQVLLFDPACFLLRLILSTPAILWYHMNYKAINWVMLSCFLQITYISHQISRLHKRMRYLFSRRQFFSSPLIQPIISMQECDYLWINTKRGNFEGSHMPIFFSDIGQVSCQMSPLRKTMHWISQMPVMKYKRWSPTNHGNMSLKPHEFDTKWTSKSAWWQMGKNISVDIVACHQGYSIKMVVIIIIIIIVIIIIIISPYYVCGGCGGGVYFIYM